MNNLEVVLAHSTILYKQSISQALSSFDNIEIVGQARYYEELIKVANSRFPDVVVARENILTPPGRAEKILSLAFKPKTIILTTNSEKPLTKNTASLVYFYENGYLIDLYRTIISLIQGKAYAQPATIKTVLSYLRTLEDSGITGEELLFALRKDDLAIMIDIILGKSFEELLSKYELSANELNKKISDLTHNLKQIPLKT